MPPRGNKSASSEVDPHHVDPDLRPCPFGFESVPLVVREERQISYSVARVHRQNKGRYVTRQPQETHRTPVGLDRKIRSTVSVPRTRSAAPCLTTLRDPRLVIPYLVPCTTRPVAPSDPPTPPRPRASRCPATSAPPLPLAPLS